MAPSDIKFLLQMKLHYFRQVVTFCIVYKVEIILICRILISNATTLDKLARLPKGPPCLLICINFQVFRDFDKIAIFTTFAKVAHITLGSNLPWGPSCLLICIGFQVVCEFDKVVIFATYLTYSFFSKLLAKFCHFCCCVHFWIYLANSWCQPLELSKI